MAKEKRFCQRCGAIFEGLARARFCIPCRNVVKLERSREHYKKHAQMLRKKRKSYYDSFKNLGEIPKIEQVDDAKIALQKYCTAYNNSDLECIKCYENQIAEYKQCRIQNQKR